jgi:hypothetical protein
MHKAWFIFLNKIKKYFGKEAWQIKSKHKKYDNYQVLDRLA